MSNILYIAFAALIFMIILHLFGVIALPLALYDAITVWISAIIALILAPIALLLGLLGSILIFLVLLSVFVGGIALLSIIFIWIWEYFENR